MNFFLAIFLTLQISLVASISIITPELKTSFAQTPLINIFVTLKDSPLSVIKNVDFQKNLDRSVRLNTLHSSLVNHATTTQAPILTFLSLLGNQTEFKSFWITNQIFVKNANLELVETLANKFGNLISSINKEWSGFIPTTTFVQTNITEERHIYLQWGIKKVKGPEAWNELGGVENAGKGVLVGIIDSGVRGTHEALKRNFVGQYGWFDAVSGVHIPIDENGHGTHVTGSAVGLNGYGVAPAAKWTSCRACDNSGCGGAALLSCGEFMLCPHLPDGTKPDCSKAPHVVSNSWVILGNVAGIKSVVAAWRAAGIVPVFGIGNEGPNCGTAFSPGNYENVIGVGSTTRNDAISHFSSLGPTVDGRTKPDICAPGSEIRSAYHMADNLYANDSGTSMATPHVSGAIALLLTRNKNLSFDEIRKLLLQNADQQLTYNGTVCDGIEDNNFPNNVFGNGRLNAYRSVRAQTRNFNLALVSDN